MQRFIHILAVGENSRRQGSAPVPIMLHLGVWHFTLLCCYLQYIDCVSFTLVHKIMDLITIISFNNKCLKHYSSTFPKVY